MKVWEVPSFSQYGYTPIIPSLPVAEAFFWLPMVVSTSFVAEQMELTPSVIKKKISLNWNHWVFNLQANFHFYAASCVCFQENSWKRFVWKWAIGTCALVQQLTPIEAIFWEMDSSVVWTVWTCPQKLMMNHHFPKHCFPGAILAIFRQTLMKLLVSIPLSALTPNQIGFLVPDFPSNRNQLPINQPDLPEGHLWVLKMHRFQRLRHRLGRRWALDLWWTRAEWRTGVELETMMMNDDGWERW